MERPLFSVPLADLEAGEREIVDEIPVSWLTTAFEGTEATPRGQPGRLEVTVSKTGREVMVRGHARAAVVLPCARTLDPVDFDLDAEIFLLLTPAAAAPPPPKALTPAQAKKREHKQAQAKKPVAHAPARREEQAAPGEEDGARDTYDGERVVLDAFVREFLVLELPMVPLREDLRSAATPAIERAPAPAEGNGSAREAIDPRLAPLADIARRLRDKKE
jgi:uncharacterized metal-binding protein YceD (DUF177 family)